MKTTTWTWLLAATAAAALVGCSNGEIPEGVAPENTVAPIDGDSSQTPADTAAREETPPPAETAAPEENASSEEAATTDGLTEAEKAILDKYDIDHEDASKAFEEIWAAAMEASATGTTQPDDEMPDEMAAILDKYDIDHEDFGRAFAEMLKPGIEEMQAAYPPCPAEGETLPADFEHGCTSDDKIQIALKGDSCFTFGDYYAEFDDRVVKRSTGDDDPAVSACFWPDFPESP